MKTEMELAMRLLERDTHEKQDTIVGLRAQIEEIKSINLDLYNKLQVSHRILNLFLFVNHKLPEFAGSAGQTRS